MPSELERIYDHIEQHRDEHAARLQEWIRQPSISNTGEGILEMGELVKRYLERLGCQDARLVDVGVTKFGSKAYPLVYGTYNAGAPKTLLIYFLFDTMPVEDPNRWISPPFEARIVEYPSFAPQFAKVMIGVGQGHKYPSVTILNALDSIKAVAGELPVNLIFIGDGDEERGSIGLHKFIHEYKDELSKADAVFSPWGGVTDKGAGNVLGGGSEGCFYVELETSGARWGRGPTTASIHGGFKRTVDSPAWRHIEMLSTLVSDNGNKVLVEGWYDNIEPPSAEDEKLLDELLPLVEPKALKQGVKRYINDLSGKDLLKRALYESTLNLDGIWGGLTFPGTAGSILPHKVTSKHNCRFVPNQDRQDLVKKLRRHLDAHGYEDVEIRVISDIPWSKPDFKSEIAIAVIKMFERFGVPAMRVPGGWVYQGPATPDYLFTRDPLHLKMAGGLLGYSGNAHTDNEFVVVEGPSEIYELVGAEKSNATVLYNYAGKS